MNKKILLGALSAVVIAGVGTAASAFADSSSTTTSSATQQAQTTKWQGHRGGGHHPGGGQLNAVANILGISVQTLQSDLQQGLSIVDVAKTKNIDESTLISDLQAKMKTRLDQAVANSKLTSDQESKILVNFATNAPKFLEHKGAFKNKDRQGMRGVGPLKEVASILGIDRQTLQSDLQQGQSIVDVAQSKGIDENTLIAKLQAQMQTHLDQAVKDGKLTQAKETKIISNFTAKLKQIVEHKGVFLPQHNHQGHPGQPDPHGPGNTSQTSQQSSNL